MTLLASGFGSSCHLSDGILKKVATSGVVDQILRLASFKADKELKKGMEPSAPVSQVGGRGWTWSWNCWSRPSSVIREQRS